MKFQRIAMEGDDYALLILKCTSVLLISSSEIHLNWTLKFILHKEIPFESLFCFLVKLQECTITVLPLLDIMLPFGNAVIWANHGVSCRHLSLFFFDWKLILLWKNLFTSAIKISLQNLTQKLSFFNKHQQTHYPFFKEFPYFDMLEFCTLIQLSVQNFDC